MRQDYVAILRNSIRAYFQVDKFIELFKENDIGHLPEQFGLESIEALKKRLLPKASG